MLVLPVGWSMTFWIAFVYQGARVGGLLEERNICFEHSKLSFPLNYPDTSAGSAHARLLYDQQIEKHNR